MSTYNVDVSQGSMSGALSSQWFRRPADETFDSLDDLYAFTRRRADVSQQTVVDTRALNIIGELDEANPSRGSIIFDHAETGPSEPSNWAFGQAARLAGAPGAYLADLPAQLASNCLNWGLRFNRSRELVKLLTADGTTRALTGADYGRIWHHEIVSSVVSMNLRNANRFKIPGVLDWSTRSAGGMTTYDPEAKGDSTLFASDRDLFGFLCDDRNPIQIGTLASGDPDLVFRGFYFWNSEEGSRTAGIAAFYLRGVCMNRCLWGIENFQEVKIRHTKFAPDRFASEAAPALESFCEGSSRTLLDGVTAAREAKVAHDQDSMLTFLRDRAGLSSGQSKAAYARHVDEEGIEPRSVWDAAQAITSIARDVPHQDSRVTLERQAGALLDKVA